MNKINKKKIALIIWTIIILVLTTFPMQEYNGVEEKYYDKIAHGIFFGIFACLVFINIFKNNKTKNIKIYFISLIISVLYSGLIEVLQFYIPGRNPSELDLLAGAFGSVLFLCIFVKILKLLYYYKYNKHK